MSDHDDPLGAVNVPAITLDELLGVGDVERVLKRLTKHAEGLIEMTPTEVAAAKIVLGKRMPDVKSVEINHTHQVRELPDAELDSRIAKLLGTRAEAGAAGPAGRARTSH